MPTIVDPSARLDALLSKAEKNLAQIFRATMAQMTSSIARTELEDLIMRNRWDEALERVIIHIESLGAGATTWFINSGTSGAAWLNNAGLFGIHFDAVNVRAVEAMRRHSYTLIRGFTEAQKEATRLALLDAMRNGVNPVASARAFRDSIGLTPRQQEAVNNYRRLLENGDRDALRRALRDRRFDSTVNRAIKDHKPLTRAQIDKMVTRYSSRYVKYRSQVIARTQSLRAVHEGNKELYQQAIDSGRIKEENLTRGWVTAVDGRERETHESINGVDVIGLNTPWVTSAGNQLLHPGDPSAPAEEVVQCRCATTTRIRF